MCVSREEAQRLVDRRDVFDPATGKVRSPNRVSPPRPVGVYTHETQEEADARTARARAAAEAQALREVPRRIVRQEGGWYPAPDVGF